jgi:hypothetical protein
MIFMASGCLFVYGIRMVGSTNNPSAQELLERIVRLEGQARLKEQLFDRLAVLERKVGGLGGRLCVLRDVVDGFRDIQHERFFNVSERIVKLEFTVFPKLLDDLETIQRIIGNYCPDAMDWHSLDRKTSISLDEHSAPKHSGGPGPPGSDV